MSSFSFDSTEGCLFLSATFWGVGTAQLYFYYEAQKDQLWLKSFVLLAWVLDTVHEALLLNTVYVYLVKDIGNILALQFASKTFAATAFLVALIGLQIQILFTMRVWKLSSGNKALVGCFIVFVLIQFITALIFFASLLPLTRIFKSGHIRLPLKSVWISVATATFVDTALALTLVYLLRKRLREVDAGTPGFPETTTTIDRIVRYTIGTGLVSAAFAFVSLVASITMTNNLIFVFFMEMYPKIYFNCMLSSLNTRRALRENLASRRREVAVTDLTYPLHTLSSQGSASSDTKAIEAMVHESATYVKDT